MKFTSSIFIFCILLSASSLTFAREIKNQGGVSGAGNEMKGNGEAVSSIPDTAKRVESDNSLTDDFLQLIRSSVFRDTSHTAAMWEHRIEYSEERFRDYSGARIAHIYVQGIEAFGNSVYDTLWRPLTRLEEFGNSLHVNTQQRIIRENLLVSEGDTVSPFILADNERILRALPFIHEARIVLIPRLDGDVDMVLLTRDVFSIGISINARNANDISASVYDRNLLGYGWNLRNTFRYRKNVGQKMSYNGTFRIENIQGSFISAMLRFSTSLESEKGQLSFQKRFITPETKYAGGVDFLRTFQNDELNNYTTLLYFSKVQDYWVGRSFQLGDVGNRENVKFGLRYQTVDYERRPQVWADSNFAYHNRKMYLGNILYSRIKYFTSYMIKGFGRAEDIPVGYFAEFTGGYSNSEFTKRMYYGGDLRYGTWVEDFGYMALVAQLGGFNHYGTWEDGLLKIGSRYFSPLSEYAGLHFRHFLTINFTRGINRINDERITINDRAGIRGLVHDDLTGTQSIILNYESLIFTPWSLLGFQFAFFDFIDLGLVGDARGFSEKNQFFTGLGLGCRIHNENLVMQTINLRFAYYPRTPEGNGHFRFEISTIDPNLFQPFKGGKPGLIPFE